MGWVGLGGTMAHYCITACSEVYSYQLFLVFQLPGRGGGGFDPVGTKSQKPCLRAPLTITVGGQWNKMVKKCHFAFFNIGQYSFFQGTTLQQYS